jgi:cytochrome c553
MGASLLCCVLLNAMAGAADADARFEVPAWLFPVPAPVAAPAPAASTPDDARLQRVPGSRLGYTRAQLRDLFAVADWHADARPPVPEVVAHGRKPDIYACGYCHLPNGAGRPENAAVAGLPAEYIVQQMRAFASGQRKAAWTASSFLPATLMAKLAGLTSDREVSEAATYFSSLTLNNPRATVVETERVPRTRAIAYVYELTGADGDEPLGNRLLELPVDFERHELRDARLEYVAYVPPGSLERGRRLAIEGTTALPSCASCHGPDLRGIGLIPPIAGRSPTYLLRQLVAFRTRARQSPEGVPMQPVVDGLDLADMIAAAAYAGSLAP